MPLQLSQLFPFCPPPPSTPHSLRQSPHHLFMPMGHVYKFFGYSISYPVLYIPWLFCNYLCVLLNPLTSSPTPPSHLATVKMLSIDMSIFRIHDSVSVLLVCLVCFLDSIFICIYFHFIVHSLDLLFLK